MIKFITSKWIPIVILCVLVLSLTFLKLIGSLTDEAIVILQFMVYLPLVFLYIPALTITVIRTNHPNKLAIINSVGLFCIALWLATFLDKIFLHTPGAALHILAGSIIFLTTFLPAWFIVKRRKSMGRLTGFYVVMANFFASLIMYGWFNTMHYPFYMGANYYCLFSGSVFALVLMYYLIKGKIKFDFAEQFIFIFLVAYIFGMRQMAYLRDQRHNSVSTSQEQVEKNLEINKRKTCFIYDAFKNVQEKDSLFRSNYEKIQLIERESDSLQKYIRDLKTILVSKTSGMPRQTADTLKFNKIPVSAKANYDFPTQLLFDSLPENSDVVNYNAIALRKKLLRFSDTLLFFSPQNFKTQFKQYNPIQIEDQESFEDGRQLTWEVSLFDHQTLGMVFTQLTSIQNDAKGAEILVLNELFNETNQNKKENVAAQLAELSLKYETEKKEKQISLLKKDKELNDSRLMAKDEEISQTRDKLIYIVFALVLFVILIVFVIRANVQRKKANRLLTEQKAEISEQKEEVEKQKRLIEEKNKEIEDSITYARRLQEAILPPKDFINKYCPDNFVLYLPKDIVAGDFYWSELSGDKFYIAAADSTGHGVPGAMVSVVCSNALNRAIKEFKETETGRILDITRELVIETFAKSANEVKDGMDISLLCIDRKNKKISWSGANNPLWYVQDNALKEIKADKQPIGKSDHPKPFTTHAIDYREGTSFYLFTDGLADQFGGPKGKKFKYKQFSDTLLTNKDLTLNEQLVYINKVFLEWKSNLEQVDDVCVIGIKI